MNIYIVEADKWSYELVKQNKELGEALERANEDKAAYVQEHNALVDDYRELQTLSQERLTALREKDSQLAALEHQMNILKTEAEKASEPVIIEDHPDEQAPEAAQETNHTPSGYYTVKLGKKYVNRNLELKDLESATYGDPDLVKELADSVGGMAQELVLVDIGEDQQ